MLPSLLYMTKTPKTKLVSAILQTAVTFVNSKGLLRNEGLQISLKKYNSDIYF